jgi:hypothetical protein
MTKFEQALEIYSADQAAFREGHIKAGLPELLSNLKLLKELQNKINIRLLADLFGAQTGNHLAEKFISCDRNIVVFLDKIDQDKAFFILYKLKTDKLFYMNS